MILRQDALLNAAQWVAQIMAGSLGTILAVIAIATTGFAMLRGHVPVSKGVRIVLGCFVLFGAPVIARSLVALGGGPGIAAAPSPPPAAMPDPPPAPTPPYDPYAGASVPM